MKPRKPKRWKTLITLLGISLSTLGFDSCDNDPPPNPPIVENCRVKIWEISEDRKTILRAETRCEPYDFGVVGGKRYVEKTHPLFNEDEMVCYPMSRSWVTFAAWRDEAVEWVQDQRKRQKKKKKKSTTKKPK